MEASRAGSETHFIAADPHLKEGVSLLFEKMPLLSFDRLVVSWEGKRPSQGKWHIEVSLLTNQWSPWLDYAIWGPSSQNTFTREVKAPDLRVFLTCQMLAKRAFVGSLNAKCFSPTTPYDLKMWRPSDPNTFHCIKRMGFRKKIIGVEQDVIKLIGEKGRGCRVRFTAQQGASLTTLRGVSLSFLSLEHHRIAFENREHPFILLPLPGLSQMALADERGKRLCSPTSSCAVIRYLTQNSDLTPSLFADGVRDHSCDIYGNWILNTAQAAHLLGEKWRVSVAYLSSFDEILAQLTQGFPVIVSVKGKIPGAPLTYDSGHLMVVTGYDPALSCIYCLDPAYETDEKTVVSYDAEAFLSAWHLRHGLAYLFSYKEANP